MLIQSFSRSFQNLPPVCNSDAMTGEIFMAETFRRQIGKQIA
jgi:hypothetical protein